MSAFTWGPDDVRPRGTGKTTLAPLPSLEFNDDGTLARRTTNTLMFKDEHGFRPVCPFLELHGDWDATGNQPAGRGPITEEILQNHGANGALANLQWEVWVANLKPYHMTQDLNDIVEARIAINGDDTSRHELLGITPGPASNPLIPSENTLPLGAVRLSKPSEEFPGVRLRFFPAKGFNYGPTDFQQRLDAIPANRRSDYEYQIPTTRLIINPDAAWCRFNANDGDGRTNPGGLYASDDQGQSLGIVDDVCDGLVTCRLTVGGTVLTAHARVAVGPPDYAPDRRPVISIADGLKDRVDREDQHVDDEIIRDLFERAWETMGLLNVEVQNTRVNFENPNVAYSRGLPLRADETKAFNFLEGTANEPLPLTEKGRRLHRQFSSLDALKNRIREDRRLLERVVRPPAGDNPFYTIQMPALMRGSDRYPLHLTRRQYDLLIRWARQISNSE